MDEKNEKKDLEIVSDDGSSLDISPVYDHLNAGMPRTSKDKPTNIVIPKEKKEIKKENENEENDEEKENEENSTQNNEAE